MSRADVARKLKDRGVQATPQRVEVAEVLLKRPQHLSAEQILDALRGSGSRVSKATVYNTLNVLCDVGLVRELNVDASRKFYDSTTHPHHHFYNVDTGRLSDIAADQVSIAELPALPEGTVEESVEILIRVRDK